MKRTHGPKKMNGGFTLIELMIVVAVVAILASIAIPSYTQYVIRSNRTEGKVVLMQSAQSLERCYSRFGAYTNENCEGLFPQTSESGFYEVAFPGNADVGANSFLLSAVPQGTQATRDTKCGTLTLDHVGQKGLGTGAKGSVDECW